MLFDLVVGASSIYGGSWLEGAGAVFAENQALAWLAELAGLPVGRRRRLRAGRHDREPFRARRGASRARARRAPGQSGRGSAGAAEMGGGGKLRGALVGQDRGSGDGRRGHRRRRRRAGPLHAARRSNGCSPPSATTATSSCSPSSRRRDDESRHRGRPRLTGRVGGRARRLVPRRRRLRRSRAGGAERPCPRSRASSEADSFVVDPHKWLFAPFDCAALLYRDPEEGKAAHAQHAGYLEPLQESGRLEPLRLTPCSSRGGRGACRSGSRSPLSGPPPTAPPSNGRWRSRATPLARSTAAPSLELFNEPDLSVVCFRRLGWERGDYYAWSERLLTEGLGFVTPTSVSGEVAARFAIVNPVTTEDDIDQILDTMD